MKFLIIGGSGRTGQLVISEAISKGHQVIALVRKESSLPQRENLTVVRGSPLSIDEISAAIASSSTPIDAVFVTLNARRTSDSPFAAPHPDSPPHFMADSVRNLLSAMRVASHPIPKIVYMASVGVGSSLANTNFLFRSMFTHTNMRHGLKDHDEVDQELKRAKDVKFVEVRPWVLKDGEAVEEVKVFGDDGKGAGWMMPSISRRSVARFMVEAAETSKYDGSTPVITN